MKKTFLLAGLCVLLFVSASAQNNNVGIGTLTPNASALLDISSTTKGLLTPRMTKAERDLIATPATGLLIYQTDDTAGFYVYNGTAWTTLGSSSQLEKITENSKTGWRLLGRDAAKYGDIGSEAVDLSYAGVASNFFGATGNYSTALGWWTVASGEYSTAMGAGSEASGTYATAIGYSTFASGVGAMAMGNQTVASGAVATAMGGATTASGAAATAMGSGTTASGAAATAMGINTTAKSYAEVALGIYNTSYTPASATVFNAADRAFGIGIGTSSTALKDGLILYKDGTLFLNKLTAAPTTTTDRIYNVSNVLYINGTVVGAQTSDARYKERVEDLPSALANIKKLRPVSYYWKDQKWGAQKEIGFIAQELKTQYPEVVVTDTDGYHKVNYGVLTAVLTKGMQEQQSQIEALGTKNEQLEKENAALKAQLSGFADRLGNIEKALNATNHAVANNKK